MKRLLTICLLLSFTLSLFAQVPEKMSYQAIIRDGNNNLITSSAVGMQISILRESATGTEVYVETQMPTTSENGLISIEIGLGTAVSGVFSEINWTNGPFFIKTEIDPTGGSNYTIAATSELLSVPYAFHAKTSNVAKKVLDHYVTIWSDNATVNLEPNKKYFIHANNITLVLPESTENLGMDQIEIYVMQHKDNPRNITVDWENSLPIGAMDSSNNYVGGGLNQPSTASGHFQSGYNKIINIGDFWMCGSFTPN